MKFTLSWLKRHLDTDATLEEISDKLTAIGLEVEDIADGAEMYAPFTVAYVEKAEQHPDADKLRVCTVKSSSGVHQVVCGAPNAKTGMYAIFAPEGSVIPGLDNLVLKKAKIRGVESCGMLVSEKEMCLSDEHKGIIELEGEPEIGTPMAEIFGLDDPVIEIALTPNRADCAGVYGIARDLAAAGLGTLKPVLVKKEEGNFASDINVTIEDIDGCAQFLGRQIKGVKNAPSPEWFQKLLKAVGLRPISALVDITNFLSLDHARPLHVYDADKVSGDIVVRETKGGESFEALDDKTYTVSQGAVGIFDDSGLIGLGGIVGGESTGCTEETTNVFLEAAYFMPERIARAGRDLGVQSDARYRFERGVDPVFTETGLHLASALITEFCGGEVSEVVRAGAVPAWQREIEYKPEVMKNLIGVDVDTMRQEKILQALGFDVRVGPQWSITPPSWRGDVFGSADIAEEIIRIVGFDAIPSVSVHSSVSTPIESATPLLANVQNARSAMVARGMDECVTWSFLSDNSAKLFGLNDNDARKSLTLQNAISSEIDVMRPSILPNLLQAVARSADQGMGNVAFCEVGPTFQSLKPEGQAVVASGLRAGQSVTRNWASDKRDTDMYDVKADALDVLEACGAPAASAQITRDAPDYFHPGRSGAIRLGKNVLAYFGELHPAVLENMGVKSKHVCGFEVFLENIPQSKSKGTEKPLLVMEPLLPIERDFAFVVDQDVAAEDVRRTALAAEKKLIVDAQIFDVYQGKGIEDGKKSLALSIAIQPRGESLTDKDIDAVMQSVIDAVAKKCDGVLRG